MTKNLSGQSIGAQMINATTGAAFTGTVTVYLTGDAGTQAIGSVGSGICTHEGNGYHTYRPAQAETNYDLIAFTFVGTGAIPATIQVATITTAQSTQLQASSSGVVSSVTARDLITGAYQILGVLDLSDALPAALGQMGFRRLNGLVSNWAVQSLTIPTSSRTVIPIVLGKGTEANPITIGPTGDVVMTTRPLELDGAGLLLSGVAPRVEIMRAVYTDDQWDAVAVKDMTASMFTGVFYTPSVPNGEIVLWPVPDTTIHSLVIYRGEQIPAFATLSTAYVLPDGYVDALEFNLAVRLGPGSGVQVTPELQDLARSSLAAIKRANNTTLYDLGNDFAYGGGGYDIYTGNM